MICIKCMTLSTIFLSNRKKNIGDASISMKNISRFTNHKYFKQTLNRHTLVVSQITRTHHFATDVKQTYAMHAQLVARTLPVRCPYVARTSHPDPPLPVPSRTARPRAPPLPVRCPYVARTAPERQTDTFSQLTLIYI